MTGIVITDPIIEVEVTTDKTIEVDKTIKVMTLDKRLEIGSESRDRSRNYSNDRDRSRNRSRNRDGKTYKGPELCQMTEEDQDPGPTLE